VAKQWCDRASKEALEVEEQRSRSQRRSKWRLP